MLETETDDLKELFEADLSCPICRDVYINPLILNCSHSFCKFCVFRWLSKSHCCPECRVPVTFQAENLALRNVINKLISKTSQQNQTQRSSTVSQRLKDEEEQSKESDTKKIAKLGRNSHSIHHRLHNVFGRPPMFSLEAISVDEDEIDGEESSNESSGDDISDDGPFGGGWHNIFSHDDVLDDDEEEDIEYEANDNDDDDDEDDDEFIDSDEEDYEEMDISSVTETSSDSESENESETSDSSIGSRPLQPRRFHISDSDDDDDESLWSRPPSSDVDSDDGDESTEEIRYSDVSAIEYPTTDDDEDDANDWEASGDCSNESNEEEDSDY